MKFILKINALLLLWCCSACAKRIVIKVERKGDYSYGYVQATKDSIWDGEGRFYYGDKLGVITHFKKGKYKGHTKFINPTLGTVFAEGNVCASFFDDYYKFKVGKWIYYDDSTGAVKHIDYHRSTFEYDKIIEFFPNGKIRYVIEYGKSRKCLDKPYKAREELLLIGDDCDEEYMARRFKSYFENGKIKSRGQYKDMIVLSRVDGEPGSPGEYGMARTLIPVGKWVYFNDTLKTSREVYYPDTAKCIPCTLTPR